MSAAGQALPFDVVPFLRLLAISQLGLVWDLSPVPEWILVPMHSMLRRV